MIKLVASDLDGTLLMKGAQSLPEDIFPLIRQLKDLGILFIAASGRQYANMKKMFAPVADDMAFICENGGLAVYHEKVRYQNYFDQNLVREIAECIYNREGSEFTWTAWVDFIPFTTNKARGLDEYQKILNIKPEECITFGDEYNDIDMLKSVPYGFAMAHAKPGVKEVAAYETDRVQTILKKLIKAKGNIEEVLKECIQKKQ